MKMTHSQSIKILKDPNTPIDVLNKYLQEINVPQEHLILLAQRTDLTDKMYCKLASYNLEVTKKLAANPALPKKLFKSLIQYKDNTLKDILCANINLDSSIMFENYNWSLIIYNNLHNYAKQNHKNRLALFWTCYRVWLGLDENFKPANPSIGLMWGTRWKFGTPPNSLRSGILKLDQK